MTRLILLLFSLSAFAGCVFAQQGPSDLRIVGQQGWGVHVRHEASGSLPPIVLKGDEVLYPGHLDCGLSQGHPQCRSLDLLLGDESVPVVLPPEAIVIQIGAGATLLDVTISTYPPPVVIVEGCPVTKNDYQEECTPEPSDLQVVDVTGEIVLIHQIDSLAGPPAVLLDQVLLNPGGVGCEVVSGLWECQWASGATAEWPEQGSVSDGVYTDLDANVLIDFGVGDAPPPIVYKDGNVLNRQETWRSPLCTPCQQPTLEL